MNDSDSPSAPQKKPAPAKSNNEPPSSPAPAATWGQRLWHWARGLIAMRTVSLRDDLLAIATSCGDFVAKPSPYGVKYETVGELGTGGYRSGKVVTVWIVEENMPPRLVTAYPGNG